jgi:uncharacterized membrane protein
MQTSHSSREYYEKLALAGLFTALVAVLSYFGGFIKIGGFASVSLTLIPVVLGGALLGPMLGAWLGAVSGIVFFFTADAPFWLGLSIHGTIITVMLKGILAGLLAGSVYRLLEKCNRYLAIVVSAIVCPVVNTGIFILGCYAFFFDFVKSSAAAEGVSVFAFMILFFVGLNFVFELIANIVVSPALLRVINFKKKN